MRCGPISWAGSIRNPSPHVFRPTFYREEQDDPRNPGRRLSVVRLAGLEEVTNAFTQVLNTAWTNWMDFENPVDVANLSIDPSLPTRTNVFGIPYLVGTKQNQTGPNALGLPKFNEAFWQTRVRTGRRLLLERQPNGAVRPTNETTLSALGVVKYGQYTFQVVNTAAAEGGTPTCKPSRPIARCGSSPPTGLKSVCTTPTWPLPPSPWVSRCSSPNRSIRTCR